MKDGLMMNVINDFRVNVWMRSTRHLTKKDIARIDVDGAIVPATGDCNESTNLSYKGVWG